MKKFFLFCFVAAAVATFVSCSKNDDDGAVGNSSLVGRWECYKFIEYFPGEELSDDEDKTYDYITIMEFRSNGTGTDIEEGYELTFRYSLSGNKLRITWDEDGDIQEGTIEKLTADELVIVYHYKDPVGLIARSCYKRI